MHTDTVIFDMDGLLIDSEPLWEEAAAEVLQEFGIQLTQKQYHDTRGLRTEEWLNHWFRFFTINQQHIPDAINSTISKAVDKIDSRGVPMPGVQEIFALFRRHRFKIGLATSSPLAVVDVVAEKLNLRQYLQVTTSAQFLNFGKPHPEVYLNCAAALASSPVHCLCFEDSFNGMIAAKAARMKCVVIPDKLMQHELKWNAADMQLSSLIEFGEDQLKSLR